MKELYQNPEMDVVAFSVEDVIATSIQAPGGMGGPNEGGLIPF